MAVFKGDEFGTSKSSNRLSATNALLGEQITEAVSAVRLLISGGKFISSQHPVTVSAGEALTMPWSAFVGDTTLVDNAIALHTALSILLLIARDTHDLLVTGDKALVANGLLAYLTTEALLMPLLALVLILLHTSTEDVLAAITASSKVVVMTVGTEQFLVLGRERLIDQGVLAVAALEAFLMPVLLLVGKVLRVSSDGSLALLAGISEQVLVTLDAVRVLITKDVTVTSEVKVTVKATEMSAVPVLLHGFGIFSRKDQRIYWQGK